jgi:hypothetical protein
MLLFTLFTKSLKCFGGLKESLLRLPKI